MQTLYINYSAILIKKKKSAEDDSERAVLDMGTENDINEAFNTVVRGGTARDPYKKKKKEWKRDENYIKYESLDKYGEAGYALDSGFSSQVIIICSGFKGSKLR